MQKAIVAIIRSWRPDLLEEFGVGPIVAATVLYAWSHPGRIHCRGGVRDARRRRTDPGEQWPSHHPLSAQPLRRPPAHTALHTVVQSRIQYQPATRDYVPRRTAEGKTSREIKRCLARSVARDLYRLLVSGTSTA